MLEVIISSLGYAGGVAADKIILDKHRVPVMRFIPLLFIWLALITALFLPMWGRIDYSVFHNPEPLIIFALMIGVAVTWNVFYYQGIQKENLAEFELIMLFTPLATVILAEIFVPSERDLQVFVAGLISSVALIASRFRRHHVKLSFLAKRTMLAMILMSFESILIKYLLTYFSPASLYFVRTTIIALIFIVLYRPKLFSVSLTAYSLTVVSAIFGVTQMVLKFYGFQNLGIIETTMILLLGPILVYIISYFYFHEMLYKRDLLAMIVIVASILYVQFGR
jgi:drug/metabolite transporter (DMT)-like permease